MPLKGIPFILSPAMLYELASAGHGDDIVLADAHFPTSSICRGEHGPHEIRADGLKIPELLDAILKVFPLDTYVKHPVALMDLVRDDKARELKVPIWDTYREVLSKADKSGKAADFELVERFAFYERSKKAFVIIHTGETAQYGNIILKKGVVLE